MARVGPYRRAVAEFVFTELLPLGPDTTSYRLVSTDGVSTFETSEGTFLKVEPSALTRSPPRRCTTSPTSSARRTSASCG